jgi:hypothetical protein
MKHSHSFHAAAAAALFTGLGFATACTIDLRPEPKPSAESAPATAPAEGPPSWDDEIVGDGEIVNGVQKQSTSSSSSGADGTTSSSSGSSGASSSGGSSGSSGSSGSCGAGSCGSTGAGEGSSGSSGSSSGSLPAGILTAGVWDDNRNFDRFSAFLGLGQNVSPHALFTAEEHERARHTVYAPGPKQKLDISLVIDTTGSMGDELAYLQRELDAITARIQRDYPGAEQRWSLVLYRDNGDAYTVRWFNFRGDVADYRAKLAQQAASGGGDYAEATDQAIDIAQRLQWRRDAQTARLVFWVADAPHHAETTGRLAASVRSARVKGIHVYPVASSGVDEMTEASMRSIAQLTGGRYLFLTDDSGVGLPHKEPRIPCYFVTKLDSALLRMVDIELTGKYREPTAADVVRSGGNPQNGACTLAAGAQPY